jgi:hypothetical protein
LGSRGVRCNGIFLLTLEFQGSGLKVFTLKEILLQIKANAETQSLRQKNRQALVKDYRGNDKWVDRALFKMSWSSWGPSVSFEILWNSFSDYKSSHPACDNLGVSNRLKLGMN